MNWLVISTDATRFDRLGLRRNTAVCVGSIAGACHYDFHGGDEGTNFQKNILKLIKNIPI